MGCRMLCSAVLFSVICSPAIHAEPIDIGTSFKDNFMKIYGITWEENVAGFEKTYRERAAKQK